MGSFFSFPDGVKTPRKYSSVIFPTCEDKDYYLFRTFDDGMVVVEHIFARGNDFSLWGALECFAGYRTGDCFFELARRFALYRRFPYFLYNDVEDGNTYFVTPENGERRLFGQTVYTDKDPVPDDCAFVISYRYATEVGHIMLMLLGYIVNTTPGLNACRTLRVPIEEALAQRDAAEQSGESIPPEAELSVQFRKKQIYVGLVPRKK